MSVSRRSFLRTAALGMGASAFLNGLSRLGVSSASAGYCGAAADYKALVCVFLTGGNDGNNMVIPNDAAGMYAYSKYSAARNAATCDFSIPQAPAAGAGIAISPTNLPGSSFMLHPSLVNMASHFSAGRLAVVCNTGTLVEPTHKDLATGILLNGAGVVARKPTSMMSHKDQQDEWQIGRADPSVAAAPIGWGGGIADQLAYQGFPMVLSDAGQALFIRSADTTKGPIVVPATGTFGLTDSGANRTHLAALAGQVSSNHLIAANQAIMTQALANADALNAALAACSQNWGGIWTGGGGKLTLQLKKIANIIAAAGSGALTGAAPITRQIFFCSLGGFDNHSNQGLDQAALLADVDFALNAFQSAMTTIGAGSKVTTFTMSDFARTLEPGSVSGTDHAWGSHHLVLGDAVHGGKFFGTYPDITLGGPDDMDGSVAKPGGEGRWIPTTSVDQYAATLASWFDPTVNLNTLLPNLANFSPTTLGFL